MKKNSLIILAVLLTVSALTGCVGRNSSPEQNNVTDPAYEKLIAYKTENYSGQSVADFNAALASTPDELTEFLAAEADVINVISPDDENYDFFTTTMTFSAHELYCEHMGEEFIWEFRGNILQLAGTKAAGVGEEGIMKYSCNCS